MEDIDLTCNNDDVMNQGAILLQTTQYSDGKVELSIQGLNRIEDIENWINCTNPDIFMEYLKYF